MVFDSAVKMDLITFAKPLELSPFLVNLSVVEYTGSRLEETSLAKGAEISG